MLTIEGIITQIIFRNEDNGYTVATMDTDDGDITVVGNLPLAEPGKSYLLTGDIVVHDNYGEQFRIESASISMPKSKNSLKRYLSSGIIPFIGKKMAEVLVEKFGEDTLKVIEEDPSSLKKIRGLGKKKIKAIHEAVVEEKASRESIIFLNSLGFGMKMATKIYSYYGDNTILKIKTEPYDMMDDIKGIGFLTVDSIAMKNGVSPISEKRIYKAIKYILDDAASSQGHCYLYREDLIKKVSTLLSVEGPIIEKNLDQKILETKLFEDRIENKYVIYNQRLFNLEERTATRILDLAYLSGNQEVILDSDFLDKIRGNLDDVQFTAVQDVFFNKLTIITGGPGTGKTTIVKKIVELSDQLGYKVILAAPTGRASKRMEESTGRSASTIHRLLKSSGTDENIEFEHDRDNPVNADVFIIDEASMIDIEIAARLFEAIPNTARVVLVGDIDQLPSVGPGNVLSDISESNLAHIIRLEKIYRQKDTSNIVVNAHLINQGKNPILNEEGKDFFFIKSDNEVKTSSLLIDIMSRRLPNHYKFDPVKDAQLLTVMKNGATGTINMNKLLQESLNSRNLKGKKIEVRDDTYYIGDKVMQKVNDYSIKYKDKFGNTDEGVFNGDIGYIYDIDEEEEKVIVEFDDGKMVEYERTNMDELMLSYAITIHKSQGSEFDYVIIPVHKGPYMLLNRNLIYTAITRAKKLVVLVGDRAVLSTMIDNNFTQKRLSSLSHRIKLKVQLFGAINEFDR